MAAIQTPEQIEALLSRAVGQTISTLQVLGINALKTTLPMPDALTGDVITSSDVQGRLFTICTAGHEVTFDLQRTGRLVWLETAERYVMAPGSPGPTVRLILANGQGLDLTEPAKTKRITVTISARS